MWGERLSQKVCACKEHHRTLQILLLPPPYSLTCSPTPPTLREQLTHQGPGSCPPLCWAGHLQAGPPDLRPIARAGLGQHDLVGTIGDLEQALHLLHCSPCFPQLQLQVFHSPITHLKTHSRGARMEETLPPGVISHPLEQLQTTKWRVAGLGLQNAPGSAWPVQGGGEELEKSLLSFPASPHLNADIGNV